MLGQIYKREKKRRHTGWGQLAALSLWGGYGASLGAAFGLPGSQPVASFLAGSLAVSAIGTQVKVSRAYEAARTDTIRLALRLDKNVDQKILSHYGHLLVGAARKDLTAATAQLKKAEAKVKTTEEGYLQHEVSFSNRITHWFSAKKHAALNKKLDRALIERAGSEERVNTLTAELEQLTPQFSTK